MQNILTIAGSDTLGGGGIQADLKTFEALGTFGVSAITCIATLLPDGQLKIHDLPEDTILDQLDAILNYVPLTHVKIGLVHQTKTLKAICGRLRQHPELNIITDPVLIFKEGAVPAQQAYLETLKKELLPLTSVTTPNLLEAQQLSGLSTITTRAEMVEAATIIQSFGPKHVIIKGGQRFPGKQAVDLLKSGPTTHYLEAPRLETTTIDGAGCTLSAAITAELANGKSLESAVARAKKLVYAGLKAGVHLRHGLGNVWQGAAQHAF
ncbi:bifunctional hydroxymethylpyrimidine kinase/phosphomethylpyrimidine kinase [Lactobacillus curvatus]|uniref:bifunctional hydroxymethylpyrimidine kinase/phosphomethylpyrimidine kinase n=1 Tax=Latilactobacillus fragifolii TaxID=2814244 RepID=UPI0012AFCA92|nr:bifunctional hydroxymethylpyrimidine kinase/phosphomethylpyrimidine kinase [Latilactobacillus fragifolii]MSD83347.1 bifunctional hydroxymethylpyrimidine kinase/phosphomethylpyrimidine kinase [Latilactobacillus curvatus]MSE23538.1 bifunctional hydroxymethylpyrimidine kinase/phosphomethylpyrimidine kinase [Latilactobacillus curvatus]